MGVAAQAMARALRMGHRAGPMVPAGASLPGVPILSNSPGLGARVVVEAAWGGSPSTDESTWTWSDITSDVQVAGGDQIVITPGLGNEATTSQPATLAVTLDNRTGDYSLGGQSRHWPYVRRGTPIRVRIITPATVSVRFEGYADGWTPSWDTTGNYAIVKLSASGTLRRLGQGDAVLLSTLRYSVPSRPALVAYWPCEDVAGSTSIASGLPGGQPMTISGAVTLAADSTFASSLPLPTFGAGSMAGTVPAYTPTGQIQVQVLLNVPNSGMVDQAPFFRLITTGLLQTWDIYYGVGGAIGVAAYDVSGAQVYNEPISFLIDGVAFRLGLQIWQDGNDVTFQVQKLPYGPNQVASYATDTITNQSIGGVYAILPGVFSDISGVTLGQITIESALSDFYSYANEFNAFEGENSVSRLTRLCAENNVPLYIPEFTYSDVNMGPQWPDTLINLLRECEAADGGILYDGISSGLAYQARWCIETSGGTGFTPPLQLDAAAGDVADPFAPVDDDQRTRNQWTVTRKNGSSATFADVTGPMGTDAVGVYDDSVTLNIASDADLTSRASWLVHLGTAEGYRHPEWEIALHKRPNLIGAWLATRIGDTMTVANVHAIRVQYPADLLRNIVQGWQESIDQYLWSVTINSVDGSRWLIGNLSYDGAESDGPAWIVLDTDGAHLAALAPAGSSTITVTTPSGPLWTTNANDFPLHLSIAGIRVDVTACSGSSSPQTMTVVGSTVTKDLPAGADVSVYEPAVLGVGG